MAPAPTGPPHPSSKPPTSVDTTNTARSVDADSFPTPTSASASNMPHGLGGFSRTANGNGASNDSNGVLAPSSPATSNTSSVITYDVVCKLDDGTFPQRFRAPPWKLLMWDLECLLSHLFVLHNILLPLAPLSLDVGPAALVGQVVMIVVSLLLTAILIASIFVAAPVIPLILILVFCWIVQRMQGTGIRASTANIEVDKATDVEAWFCINGVGTTSSGALLIANTIEKLFQRRVTAIINRSLGIWFDLIECILQRDLLLTTPDIRDGYKDIRAAVRDPRKKRVVILAHSQGGIIASAWVDQLLCDFPEEILSKVEIYTFASAANHFSRPTSRGLDFPFLRTTNTAPFGQVEHFANEGDFVSQFGVLGNAPAPPEDLQPGDPIPKLNGVFGGRIFLRKGHTGHLFNSHYLLPGNSILDDPEVLKNSHLVKYLDGKNIAR